MPVVFTSHGYDTTTTNPYTEVAWADAHPSIGSATYGVRSALAWKVTPVAGQDRTVSVNAGAGFGNGITDETVSNETIQLDTIGSGSRWDLIACRRDWTPTAGESKFVKINGGSTAVIPGGRQVGAGNIDDQPIALVQVTAGQTQPTAIIDLRTWVGDGGGLVGAHDLVRSFLNDPGTRIYIASTGIDWVCRVGANDTPEWVDFSVVDMATVPLAVNGWTNVSSALPARVERRNGIGFFNGFILRANGTNDTVTTLPVGYRPMRDVTFSLTSQNGEQNASDSNGPQFRVYIVAATGAVTVNRLGQSAPTWQNGVTRLPISVSYPLL